MKILLVFWGSLQKWASFRGHFYAFYGLFLSSWNKMGIFFGLLKFQIFLGLLGIPDIFGGEQ